MRVVRAGEGLNGVLLFDIRIASTLESVDLHQQFLCNSFFNQEIRDLLSLITLKLNYLSKLWVIYKCPVATEFLLKSFQDFFIVKLRRESLNRCERLPPVTLLNSDMNVILIGTSKVLCGISERIK